MNVDRIVAGPLTPDATQYLVRMRDGVRLATDVYLPDGDEAPGPAVLIRLPYDKVGAYTFIPRIAAAITARGYRVVAQDVRGKFRSEGETLLFVNEARDGADTLDWIVQQPWSDGAVAMWGDSYYGFTQLAAASTGHPALKAIAPRVTGTRLGERPVDRSGERVRDVEMGIGLLYPLTHFHSNDTFEWEPDWSRRPYLASLDRFIDAVGERSISFDAMYPHPVPLRRFTDGAPFAAPAVPMLMTIGWWDNCAPWSWADVTEIAESSPHWAASTHLYIDAIDHENYWLDDPDRAEERSEAGLAAVVEASVGPSLDFFDVYVRGCGSPADVPRVRWQLAATDEWREAPSWPPPGTEPCTLRAAPGGRLAVERGAFGGAGDGAPERAADVETATWVHDPDALVPSSVANPFAYLLEKPDEAPLGDRDDVLVFRGEPVDEAIDLVGPVVAHATVDSSGPSIDVFVRLLDESPDGSALRIARGQVHVRDVDGPVGIAVDLGHLGYRLAAGHRLRVHVMSSDFPEFVPQPGTGADPWSAVEVERNAQSIVVGGPRGLRIEASTLTERRS